MKGEVGLLEAATVMGYGHRAGSFCCCGNGSEVQSGIPHVSCLQLRQPLPGGVNGTVANGRQPCGVLLMPSAKEIGVRPVASLTSCGMGGNKPAGMADCRKPHSGLDGGVASSGVAGKGMVCSPASPSPTLTDDDGGVAVAAASLASTSSKLDTGGTAVAVMFAEVSSRRNGGGGDLGSVLLRLKDRLSGTT